jgi:hypothetical protein
MRDNLRQYRALRDDFKQGQPSKSQGQRARHVVTLAALTSGIVASQSTQLPKIASQVPNGTTSERRVTRFARWRDNGSVTVPSHFVPYAALSVGIPLRRCGNILFRTGSIIQIEASRGQGVSE